VRFRASWRQAIPTPEDVEREWQRDLTDFAKQILVPYGGVSIGLLAEDTAPCIALTSVGRYLVGQADDFDYEHEQREEGQVVVQPNFEIAFLSPAPLAEATLARFAERLGAGLGSLFRLTKSAIFAAADAGMTCDRLLDTLRELSTKELPQNVVREIEDWFGQCRKVKVQTTALIRCPDADTAVRVMAAGGKQTELLTDTIVAVPNAKAKTDVLKKLKKAGIFVDRGGR
jgi:hypothetical protein